MKKTKIVILFIALIILILFVMNKFHFLYSTACGSGIAGLRLLAIYIVIILIICGVWLIRRSIKTSNLCRSCKSNIQEDWEICPYCGTGLEGRSTIR